LVLQNPGSREGLALGGRNRNVDGVLGEISREAVFFLAVLGAGGREGGREGGKEWR